MSYNPWPIGHIPKHLQRPELDLLKERGYKFDDPREVLTIFEAKTATHAGSQYAVMTDCCTHAMELSLRYLLYTGELEQHSLLTIPRRTYCSVPIMLMRLGFQVELEDLEWTGAYIIKGSRVIDGAARWTKGMYKPSSLHCLSYQIKKRCSIGRGGAILTDDEDAARWLKLASYDGRDLNTPYDSEGHIKMFGYHYYMTPEDAARGIILMDALDPVQPDVMDSNHYPLVDQMLGEEYFQ